MQPLCARAHLWIPASLVLFLCFPSKAHAIQLLFGSHL